MEKTRTYTLPWNDMGEDMLNHAFKFLERKLDATREDRATETSRLLNMIECLDEAKFAFIRHGNFLNLVILLDDELYLGAAKRNPEDNWDVVRGIHLALEAALDSKPLSFPPNVNGVDE